MKQIFFLGNLNQYSRSYQRYRAFRDLGHQVKGMSLVPQGRIPGVSGQHTFLEKLRIKIGYPKVSKEVNETLGIYLQQMPEPDIVWIESGGLLHPHTVELLKQVWPTAVICLYSNDNLAKAHNRTRWLNVNIRLADVVFTVHGYSDEYLYHMGAQRVIFFHRAYDKLYLTPRSPDTPYEHDVLFVGTYERERYDYLRFLARHEVSVTVFGNHWPVTPMHNLYIQAKPLYEGDFIATLHASRIVLNFLRKMNDDVTTGRTFEIPGSGSFMLAEYSDAHAKYFIEGKEAEFFRTPSELVDKVRHYLTHPKEREHIATNGLLRCQNSGYTFHERLCEMLNALG